MVDDDVSPELCAVCGTNIDLDADASLAVHVTRGLEEIDDDSFADRYSLSPYFCSEAHFREWALRPFPELEKWSDWQSDDESAGFTCCGWIALLIVLVAVVLIIFGVIDILQRLM